MMKLERESWKKHLARLLFFSLALCFPAVKSVEVANATRQEILRHLLYGERENASKYDHRVPPNFDEEHNYTSVTVQIYILSFDSVTETAMVNHMASSAPYIRSPTPPSYSHTVEPTDTRHVLDRYSRNPATSNRRQRDHLGRRNGLEFSVSIFLRQTWIDPRLEWFHPIIKDHLEVDAKMMEDIWTPDLYFLNEKEATMHEVTVSNKLLHITPDGSIRHSIRISMTLSCDMFLDRYPHDEQKCSISLGSYSYSLENVVFLWDEKDPILLRPDLTLPQFLVNFDNVSECNYFASDTSMLFGNYSCIQADFKLSREFGYYMAQVYLPSVLIVILSWVSFWIDVDATPARVSLGLLTVLTMTTHSTGEKAALPRVSYVKAIDVWMSTCLFFVFAALLEFAYVNVQARVAKRRTNSVVNAEQNKIEQLADQSDSGTNVTVSDDTPRNTEHRFFASRANLEMARLADKISRVAFPVVFILFNIGYWVHYR